jgi:hypothetical protein
MHTHFGLAHIILDFDGTCTQIPPVFEKYLDSYRRGLNEWTERNAIGMAGRAGDRSQPFAKGWMDGGRMSAVCACSGRIHTFSLMKRPG